MPHIKNIYFLVFNLFIFFFSFKLAVLSGRKGFVLYYRSGKFVCVYVYIHILKIYRYIILSSTVKFYRSTVQSACSKHECVVPCNTEFLIRRHSCGGSL